MFLNFSTMAHAGGAHLFLGKNIQPKIPILALKKSQLKNSSLIQLCREYIEPQQLKSFQILKYKNPHYFQIMYTTYL